MDKLWFVLKGTIVWAGDGDFNRGLAVITVTLFLYFLPAITALIRNHRQTAAISILTLLLGWTLLGWIAAMVWAASATRVATAKH